MLASGIALTPFSFLSNTTDGQPAGREAGPVSLTMDGPDLLRAIEPQRLCWPAPFQHAGWDQGGPLPAQPQARLSAVPPGVLLLSLLFPHDLIHVVRDRRLGSLIWVFVTF